MKTVFEDTLGFFLEDVESTTLNVMKCAFVNMTCTAIEMEGKEKSSKNSLKVSNTSFYNNKGCYEISYWDRKYVDSNSGGAIRTDKVSSVHLYKTVFKNCTTGLKTEEKEPTHGKGGAFFVKFAFKVVIWKCIFLRNQASSDGGDISGTEVRTILFEDCLFTESVAYNGGSVSLCAGNATFSNCLFTRCSTTKFKGEGGGAVYLYTKCLLWKEVLHYLHNSTNSTLNLSKMKFQKCAFRGNIAASADGGAIVAKRAVEIEFCNFDNNKGDEGGVLKLHIENKGTDSVLKNCQFRNNKGSIGGALYVGRRKYFRRNADNPYSISLLNCKFWNNHGSSSAQSIYSQDHIQIENTTLVTSEEYNTPHIKTEKADVSLSNVTVQLHRDGQHKLPSKSEGFDLHTIGRIKVSKGLRFFCPVNFQTDIQNKTYRMGYWIQRNRTIVGYDITLYKALRVGCTACPSGTYHLHSGRYYLPRLSKKVPPEKNAIVENAECKPCPTGE